MRQTTTIAPLLFALTLGACAHPHAPSGGDVTGIPFHVVETAPEAMGVEPELSGPVVLRFDERISERNLEGAVEVSPETGKVRVKKKGRELRITLEGGWRSGQIYRIVVQPVLQDLFGNTMEGAVDLIFSTGPEIPETAVAGRATDRLTRDAVDGARVEAIHLEDSMTYVAQTDTGGYFALRHIPEGDYTLRVYEDRIPNQEHDFTEPIDDTPLTLSASDTTVLTFELLAPDTTPARLTRAEAEDSTTLRLSLDDFLDPDVPLDGVTARVWHLPDSTEVMVQDVLHAYEHEEQIAERRAEAEAMAKARAEAEEAERAETQDTTEVADTVPPPPADSTVPTDTVPPAEGLRTGEHDEVGEPGEPEPPEDPLPTREFVIYLAEPLEPEAEYRITVEGVRNINELEDGGGTATFQAPAPPPEEEDPETEEDSEPDADPDADPDARSGGDPDSIPGPDQSVDSGKISKVRGAAAGGTLLSRTDLKVARKEELPLVLRTR